MEHLWTEIDEAVLQCLAHGVAGPAEIGEQLGMSEAAAASILAMLAAEGKVRICGARLSSPRASASTKASTYTELHVGKLFPTAETGYPACGVPVCLRSESASE